MGIGVSVLLIAIGAVLDFAVHTNANSHGFNLSTIGVILMVIGGIGLLVALMVGYGPWAGHRRTTVVDGADPAVGRRAVRRETYVE